MNDGFLKPEVPDWEPKWREKFRGFVTLYEEINAFCYQSLPSELSNLSIPQALCWTLFLRSMATFQTILIVLQKGLESDSKSLLRSLLEVTFVLQATTKRSSFVEEYARSNEWEERKWMGKWNRINKGKDERLQRRLEELGNARKSDKITFEQMAEWGGVSDLYYIQYSELSMYGHPSFRSLARFSDIDEQTRSINTNLNPSDREAGEILRSSIILMLLNLSGFYKFVRGKEAVAEIEDFTNRMVELSKGTKRLNLRTGEENR